MGRFLQAFAGGLVYPLRGVRFLCRQRSLWPYLIGSLAINCLLLLLLLGSGYAVVDQVGGWLLPQGQAWYYTLLEALYWLVALVAGGLVVLVAFTVLANLLAGPFNELLSARVEQAYSGGHVEPSRPLTLVKDLGRSLRVEWRKMRRYVLWFGLSLLLHLLPLVGSLLAVAVGAIISLHFIAWEYLGFTLERKQLAWPEQQAYMRRQRGRVLGFALVTAGLLALPLLQLMVMPAAVAGATLLYVDYPPDPEVP